MLYYKKCLLSDISISKNESPEFRKWLPCTADNNICIYRFKDKNSIIEDYDEDGDHGKVQRLFVTIQKMNCMNIFIMASQWKGGKHVGHERFAYYEEAIKNVLNEHLNDFKEK